MPCYAQPGQLWLDPLSWGLAVILRPQHEEVQAQVYKLSAQCDRRPPQNGAGYGGHGSA